MTEAFLLIESSGEVEMLTEQTANGKQLYIEGVFAQAELKNGNGRFYPKSIMESAVESYKTNYVNRRRALGELNHPARPFADPAEAAILIESLEWKGNNVIGKAKVLNTFKGKTVAALLEGGFNLGVSTRGLGSLRESNGMKYVQEDFTLTAVDAVDNPSAPNAYVNALVESRWMLKDGIWIPVQDVITESEVKFNEAAILERIAQFCQEIRKKH